MALRARVCGARSLVGGRQRGDCEGVYRGIGRITVCLEMMSLVGCVVPLRCLALSCHSSLAERPAVTPRRLSTVSRPTSSNRLRSSTATYTFIRSTMIGFYKIRYLFSCAEIENSFTRSVYPCRPRRLPHVGLINTDLYEGGPRTPNFRLLFGRKQPFFFWARYAYHR